MRTAKTAAALALVFALAACGRWPGSPVPERKFGDGTWEATSEIAAGTYVTSNTGPHTDQTQCEWYVTKKSSEGAVVLRSTPPTANKIQRVYIGGGDVITTHNCGTWAFESADNLTRSQNPR